MALVGIKRRRAAPYSGSPLARRPGMRHGGRSRATAAVTPTAGPATPSERADLAPHRREVSFSPS
jgi:hypothetical protein